MQNKTQFIQRFNQSRDEVRALLPDIDVQMEVYPGWTIGEVLAHLTGWDDVTILALQAFLAGEPPVITVQRSFDFYNAQTVAERQGLNYDQVVREWELVREHLIPILEQLTEEKLEAAIVSPWGPSMTVARLLDIMIEHEEDHAGVVRTRMVNPAQPPQAH